MDGCKVVSILSRSESLSGGVCILAGCDLPVEPVYLLNVYQTEDYFKSCSVVVKSLIPCILINFNRPLNVDNQSLTSFFDQLDRLLIRFFKMFQNAKIVLTGVFIIKLLVGSAYIQYFVKV